MRYFIKLSYKGTHYHGWQIQPNAITVQETLENALHTILRVPIKITGAGRTDTGVHATEMYAHFDIEKAIDTDTLPHKLNSFLPSDIAIHTIFRVKDDAHARFDATSRSYSYYIHTKKNPFLTETSWFMSKKLNPEKMNAAAQILLQHNDFKSFSKTHTDVKTYICNIKEAYWEVKSNQIVFHITADRFLRNMVRAIVGTLVDVGLEKITVSDVEKIIQSKDRSKAGFSVPAQGLFLTKIKYPKNIEYGNN